MSDYFESHEAYQDRIDAMHDAGEFVPEYDNPRGPRRPLYPCKWVDNQWVRLTDEEIEEEKQREAERLQREAELKLKERKELEENLLRFLTGPHYLLGEEREEFLRRAHVLWDEDFKFDFHDNTFKSAKRNQEEFFRKAWELTQEVFNEDGKMKFHYLGF